MNLKSGCLYRREWDNTKKRTLRRAINAGKGVIYYTFYHKDLIADGDNPEERKVTVCTHTRDLSEATERANFFYDQISTETMSRKATTRERWLRQLMTMGEWAKKELHLEMLNKKKAKNPRKS